MTDLALPRIRAARATRALVLIVALIVLIICAALWSLSVGAVTIPVDVIVNTLFNLDGEQQTRRADDIPRYPPSGGGPGPGASTARCRPHQHCGSARHRLGRPLWRSAGRDGPRPHCGREQAGRCDHAGPAARRLWPGMGGLPRSGLRYPGRQPALACPSPEILRAPRSLADCPILVVVCRKRTSGRRVPLPFGRSQPGLSGQCRAMGPRRVPPEG